MSKNSLIYFILWILLQVLVEINCQLTPFNPPQLNRHSSTLINKKLYIFGGNSLSGQTNEFFYLDVSAPFDTQNLLWQNLTNINNIVPPVQSTATAKGGANNDTLFAYGGNTSNSTAALVYAFNLQSNSWSIPTIS